MWVEFGKEEEGTRFTLRAASDVAAGELEHALAGGLLGGAGGKGLEAQEFSSFLEEEFFAV